MNGTSWVGLRFRCIRTGVEAEVLTAPYLALYNPPRTKFTAASIARCGSKNCTWDSYQSLGIRSTFQELSSSLNMT